MNKMAIITLNGYFNYGNCLQNYALQQVLTSIARTNIVETIWYKIYTLKIYQKFINLNNIENTFSIDMNSENM